MGFVHKTSLAARRNTGSLKTAGKHNQSCVCVNVKVYSWKVFRMFSKVQVGIKTWQLLKLIILKTRN